MESLGLLKKKDTLKDIKSKFDITYNKVIEKLELVKKSSDPNKIDDCSYVLVGYCPISLRLIENAIEGKWNKIK